jgi:signal transduction histidine kinase
MVEALALAAGIAIERTRLHERVRRLSVLEDRDRIGRDLHDRVIQRIFAVGMALQGATRLDSRFEIVGRVNKAVDDLDATITEIRTTIFELGDPRVSAGLRAAVVELADEMTPILGSRPEVRFFGQVDSGVAEHISDHVLAVVREAMTNAVKHGRATRFVVTLTVADDLAVEVTDNGCGLPLTLKTRSGGRGLANLRSRAEKLGGCFEIHAAPNGGTRVLWRVPLSESRVTGTE